MLAGGDQQGPVAAAVSSDRQHRSGVKRRSCLWTWGSGTSRAELCGSAGRVGFGWVGCSAHGQDYFQEEKHGESRVGRLFPSPRLVGDARSSGLVLLT